MNSLCGCDCHYIDRAQNNPCGRCKNVHKTILDEEESMTVEYIDPITIDPDDDRYENDDVYVYDGCGHVCWGPFYHIHDAEAFIDSDKYLESWCHITGKPEESFVNIEVYPPSAYHGDTRWREDEDTEA